MYEESVRDYEKVFKMDKSRGRKDSFVIALTKFILFRSKG